MWQRVARVLRATGHEVLTPSLTGIGERAHLASPATDLSTHIADVLGAIQYERLQELVLVGHSYGGMVVTGAADRVAERIATLVYLDAFVPQSGQALIDLLRPEVRAHFPAGATQLAPLPPQAQGMTDAAEIAWFDGRRESQPIKTFTQPLTLEGNYRGTRAYVFCSGYSPTSFAPFAERARNDPAWRYHELPTHHYPHVSMPRETAGVLLNYA
jgi:pimeloyl-ACP methyl ester carboxylesterase